MWELIPLPLPLQAAFCRFCKLESFRNPEPFDPEYAAFLSLRHHEFMPQRTRNLLIYKEILQFYGGSHADGLEPVSFLPISQDYPRAHQFGVKVFCSGRSFREFRTCLGLRLP